jgi:hypothetical protein
MVELADHTVAQVLRLEETKKNCEFAPRNETTAAARNRFAENPLLEAVLITDRGRHTEALLGIATRWDVLRCPA